MEPSPPSSMEVLRDVHQRVPSFRSEVRCADAALRIIRSKLSRVDVDHEGELRELARADLQSFLARAMERRAKLGQADRYDRLLVQVEARFIQDLLNSEDLRVKREQLAQAKLTNRLRVLMPLLVLALTVLVAKLGWR